MQGLPVLLSWVCPLFSTLKSSYILVKMVHPNGLWHRTVSTRCLHPHVWNIPVMRQDARQHLFSMGLVTGDSKTYEVSIGGSPQSGLGVQSLLGSLAHAESPLCVQGCPLLIKLVPFWSLYFLVIPLLFFGVFLVFVFYQEYFLAKV